MSLFTLTPPIGREIPVLVEVPHAGLAVPEAIAKHVHAPQQAVLRDADIYVDELYADVPQHGATLLCAHVSRYVVDLNRGPKDVDRLTVQGHPSTEAHRPRGVIWRVSTLGQPVIPRPLTVDEYHQRLDTYYHPYHRTLVEQLKAIRDRFGYAILIAAHSMPSVGRLRHSKRLQRRADIVPGTVGYTSASRTVIDFVDRHFRQAGLSIAHDDPYRGGWTTQHYGRPLEGVHAVQIELNRDLYVDEATTRPTLNSWPALTQTLNTLVQGLGSLPPPRPG